jgi:GNAT superfamily N-acetyltransferase
MPHRAILRGLETQECLGLDGCMSKLALRHYAPSDRDWLVDRHQTHYRDAEGFDDTFGPLVGGILDAFSAQHDPTCERGWIAQQGSTRLGSIFCVRLDETTAKLRLFLLVPEVRGTGLGKTMLQTCMAFAKGAGYGRMSLWTHESHRAAGALYRSHGWSLDSSTPVQSFGQDLVEQMWSIHL